MTLKEIEKRIFPAIYKTRSGELVEITGLALKGQFLNDDGKKQDLYFVWDSEGNFLQPQKRYPTNNNDIEKGDLIELVKGPDRADIKTKHIETNH